MKPLVDINWVSEFTGISVSTLYKLTAKDAIPVVRIGRRVLFRQEDIDEFITSHSVAHVHNYWRSHAEPERHRESSKD